ncbi:MAG: alpha/beta hydrolase [Bacteroidetes bacterium]|nr:MAG: alpha/beta hydrolase [Bacteroidota bacterium]
MVHAQSNAINVSVKGSGMPVLFLPGFACPGSVWDETVNNLTPGFQAHLVTYAGFNGVSPIPMPWYPALKEALKQYIIDQQMQQVYIVGHSMGGNLATDLAAALPERVTKILLVDAIPCMRELMMPGVPAEGVGYEAPYNTQMLNMDENAIKQYANMMASNMTNNKTGKDSIMQWMVKADRKTFVYGYVDLLKLDLRSALPSIKADVLILGASFPSKEVVQANYEKQYAQLTKKQIVLANNSKHFIMYDEPTWFYAQTNTFLKK